MYIHVHVSIEAIHVGSRDEIARTPDAAVAIGEAPDGLPLVLEIWRARDVRTPIDPTTGLALDEPAMKAYAGFIARCTAFEPAARPKSGRAFAAELRDLLDRHPLPSDRDGGWFRLGWLAGSLHRTVEMLGAAQPAWVLSDGR